MSLECPPSKLVSSPDDVVIIYSAIGKAVLERVQYLLPLDIAKKEPEPVPFHQQALQRKP
jgi:hypothetical protein